MKREKTIILKKHLLLLFILIFPFLRNDTLFSMSDDESSNEYAFSTGDSFTYEDISTSEDIFTSDDEFNIEEIGTCEVLTLERLKFNRDRKLLFEAITRGNKSIIKKLIKKHQETILNSKNENGYTSLHMAVIAEENFGTHFESIVPILLKNGADANIQDNYGRTPLFIAAAYNKQYILNLLMEHITKQYRSQKIKALDIPIVDNSKTSLLHLAAKTESMDLFEFTIELIFNKASEINFYFAKNRDRYMLTEIHRQERRNKLTALHIIVENQNIEMAKHLLAVSTVPIVRDDTGRTIFDINKGSMINRWLLSERNYGRLTRSRSTLSNGKEPEEPSSKETVNVNFEKKPQKKHLTLSKETFNQLKN